MFNKIISFFKTKQHVSHFNKKYRDSYRNLWINDIKNYKP